jgi:hypothetical protein
LEALVVVGVEVEVEVEVDGFLVGSFSSMTPPAEPARPPAVASGFAALRERACFVEAVEVGFGPGDWGFVDIVEDLKRFA